MLTARRLEAGVGVVLSVLATSLMVRAAGEPDGAAGAAGAFVRTVSTPAEALSVTGPVAPLGEAFERDEAMLAHPTSVHRTRLVARLDPATHKVHGEGEIRWRNTARVPVSEAYFHLYLNAFKNSRTAFLRRPLGEGRGGQLPAAWGEVTLARLTVRAASEPPERARDLLASMERHSPDDPDDQTDLRASLPTPCAPGDELIFELSFDSTLPSVVERTGHKGSFHMVGQWFPKLARLRPDGSWSHFIFRRLSEFDADFGDYDVTLEVPAGYVVGATGELTEESEAGGIRRLRYAQADVHDFAWTAWDGFQERRAEIEGVKVRALFSPGHEPAIDKQLDGLAVAMRCMNRRLGRYPYRTLTVVHPPLGAGEAGGMEYPTLITTGGPWHGPPWLRAAETVTVHEYGHQYFFGLLASDEHRHPFLDEGVNSFVESLCMREGYGDGGLVAAPGLTVDASAGQRLLGLVSGHDTAIDHGADDFPTAGHYGRQIYARSATLLETLRRAYGADPVDRALGRYARAYRFRHPEPAHLVAAFAEVDASMGAALEEGLLRRGWFDASVVSFETSKAVSDGGNFDGPSGREVKIASEQDGQWQGWAVVVRRGTLRLPVEIRLRFADASERREHWDGQGEWLRLDLTGPSELVSVEVDPEHKLLIDEDWSNNARSRRPSRVGLGTLDRLTFWGALLGHGLAP